MTDTMTDEHEDRETAQHIIYRSAYSPARMCIAVFDALQASRADAYRQGQEAEREACADRVRELFKDPNRGVWFRMEGETIAAILGSDYEQDI